MEQLQFAIEEESKSKAESIRMKKKLEMDMNDLEGSLKRSTLENTDLHVLVRRQQESLKSKTLRKTLSLSKQGVSTVCTVGDNAYRNS